MTDIVERLQAKKRNATDEEDDALDEILSLRQQLAKCQVQVTELAEMFARCAQKRIEDEQQLAECQKQHELVTSWLNPTRQQLLECQAQNTKLSKRVVGVGEIAINSVSRDALDTLKLQWKREALLEAAEYLATGICENDNGDYLRYMAKELE